MRFLKISTASAAVVVLLLTTKALSANPGQSLSGRLIFENSTAGCQSQCVVTLTSGLRPVQTSFADLNGNFTFANVPPGRYTIHVEIDGYDAVDKQVETLGGGNSLDVIIPAGPKRPSSSAGAHGAIVDVSEFLKVYPKKAVSLYEKGSNALKDKKTDEAIGYLRNAVEIAPTFYAAHTQLGVAYREKGDLDKAEIEFVKAHELNSSNIDPLLNLISIYIDQNQPQRAVDAGEEAVKENSHSAPAFLSLGVALYKAAQLDRAETVLKRALDLAPKLGTVRLALANVYLKLRRYDNTLEQLNLYIAENPHGEQIQAAQQMRDQLLQATTTDGSRP